MKILRVDQTWVLHRSSTKCAKVRNDTRSKFAQQSTGANERAIQTILAQSMPQKRGVDSKNRNTCDGLHRFDDAIQTHVGAALNDDIEWVALVLKHADNGALLSPIGNMRDVDGIGTGETVLRGDFKTQ